MSVCMLCQVRRADNPYYIESVGLRVYTVEELLYFMQHNLPLLDETILSEELIRWIKEELHLRRLAAKLSMLHAKRCTTKEWILPIFREVNYPGATAIRELILALDELEATPLALRMKQKADQLMAHGRYMRAVRAYEAVLDLQKSTNLGEQFAGVIYNDLGTIYAKLFLMDEMVSYFKQSNECLRSTESKKRYLYAVYLRDGEEAMKKEAAQLGEEEEQTEQLLSEIALVKPQTRPRVLSDALHGWVHDYHNQVGV